MADIGVKVNAAMRAIEKHLLLPRLLSGQENSREVKMSKAGIESNRGDAFQTLVAFDWALTILSSHEYAWLEIDSVRSQVDDVVIGMTDGSTVNCQCKKNQPRFEFWSVHDLSDELKKAARLLASNMKAKAVFYSRSPSGELGRLRNRVGDYSEEAQYLADFPNDLIQAEEALERCLSGLMTPYAFLTRLRFDNTGDDTTQERRIRERLQNLVTKPDRAFDALWARLDRLGARMEPMEGRDSAERYRLTKDDLMALLVDAGVMFAKPIELRAVQGEFARMSAIGRGWRRDILKRRLARPVLDGILGAIAEKKKSILLTGGPGSGKTCVLLDLQEALEQKGKAGEALMPLFIQSRSFAEAASPVDMSAIGLPETWVEKVARLSENERVIVIIDSLDVLSIGREHGALTYFLAQIEKLKTLPDVTVVAACREFDRQYDPRLAALTWDAEFDCGSLEWDGQIVPILSELGVNPDTLDAGLRALITNPRDLALYCEVADSVGGSAIPNALVLAQVFLDKVVRDAPGLGDSALEALEEFAIAMLRERSLSLPPQRFDKLPAIRSALISAGVLAQEEGSRLTFGHQTLLDVLAISRAIRDGQRLDEFIASLPEVPFIRPFTSGGL